MASHTAKRFLITGGAGFIGSAVIREIIHRTRHAVLNIDKLTYAGSLESLHSVSGDSRYQFLRMDIGDKSGIAKIIADFQPDVIMHLAAESHVDRSISDPDAFMHTNVLGTFNLLSCAVAYFDTLSRENKKKFRFHHVSTDEVYGDLPLDGEPFPETAAYCPSSPYAASKASSDHLVRAWNRTYGLPTVITNTSNNYGPYQYPEKLIPVMLNNAVKGEKLPIYGEGNQIRDWLYVSDHARALVEVALNGIPGQTYNIGGNSEQKNLDVVNLICDILAELRPRNSTTRESYKHLITHVTDRPGHDYRYAIDNGKIESELGWRPQETFESGLRKTISWYLANLEWVNARLGC